MKVEVQLLHTKGTKMSLELRKASRKYSGMLTLREEKVSSLERHSLVATLLSVCDAAPTPSLPVLHDAKVIHVEDGRLRIRGFEILVNGTADYPSSGPPKGFKKPGAKRRSLPS